MAAMLQASDQKGASIQEHRSDPAAGLPLPRRYWAIVAISFGTGLLVLDGGIAKVRAALPQGIRALWTAEPLLEPSSAASPSPLPT